MALTDSMLPYRELQKTAATHRCPEHPKFALQVAWRDGRYIIVCHDHEPEHLQPIPSLTQMYKRGESLPLPIVDRIENNMKRRNRAMAQESKTAISIIEASTGKLAPADQIQRAIAVAESLELNPLLGHICLYQGTPWVEIDGWYYRLRRKYGLAVDLRTRPLSEQERCDQRVEEHQHVWKAEVVIVATGQTIACGYGYSSTAEPWHKSPVEKLRPQRLAEKRAEEDAIRKVVPPGVSLGSDWQATPEESQALLRLANRVEKDTTEKPLEEKIAAAIKSSAKPAPSGHTTSEPTENPVSAPTGGKPQTEAERPLPEEMPDEPPVREDERPPVLKTVNDLLKKANKDYELQPKEVYAILGVKSSLEIADLEDAWSRISVDR